MIVRTAISSDIPALAELYRNSVRKIAPQQYSPAQVEAWAAFATETESFTKFILEATTFIAEENNLIVGFGGITLEGHLTALYVRGDYNRQGIGSKLLTEILEYACTHQWERIYSEASEFSKPLFEKFGFKIYGEEQVKRNGVLFHRYLMERFSHKNCTDYDCQNSA